MSPSPTPAAAPAPPPPRVEWIDVAKGIGILLVVLAHALRGLVSSSMIGATAGVTYVDRYIYAFHMALFFLVSGFFVEQSTRHGARAFVTDKLRTIAYPYFVWSILQGALQVAASGATNSHLGWGDLAAIPYRPIMQFWFLYTLFLVLLLYLVCHLVRLPRAGVLLLGVMLSWLATTPLPPRGQVHLLTIWFFYFAVGVFFSAELRARLSAARPLACLGLAAACFGALALLVGYTDLAWPLQVVAGLVGTVGTLLLARAVAVVPSLAFFRTWGVCSLQIYVAHTIVSATTRVVLHRLKLDVPAVQLALQTIAGVLVPIWMMRAAARVHFPYLFGWPAPPRGRAAA